MKKTTQATVVSNLQKSIDQKRDEYNSKMNMYNKYMYKMAISKAIDDQYGPEPKYLDFVTNITK
jgi:uncharacterized protein YfbU (UPF0304 family)